MDAGQGGDWPGAGGFGNAAARRAAADYIRQHRAAYDRASIDQRLADAGYDPEDVAQAWVMVDAPPSVEPPPIAAEVAAGPMEPELEVDEGAPRPPPGSGDVLGQGAFWLGLFGGLASLCAAGTVPLLVMAMFTGEMDTDQSNYAALATCTLPILSSLAILVFGLRRRRGGGAFGHGCVWSMFLIWGLAFIACCAFLGIIAALIATGTMPSPV